MIPATFIFTHAGSQLFRINSLSEILSPEILGVFVLIAGVIAFPALLKSRKKTKKP